MSILRASLLVNFALLGCASSSPRPAAAPPPNYGPYPPNYGPAPTGYSNPPLNAPPNGGGPYYTQAQPPVGTNQQQNLPSLGVSQPNLDPPPFYGLDPISCGMLQFLNNRSTQVVGEL